MSEVTEVIEQPPQTEAPPQEPPEQAQAQPVDEDAQLDQVIAEQAIDLPEGEKLVPLSAVTTVRGKLKEAREKLAEATEGSARAQQLEQQIQQLQSQMQTLGAKAQAYDAAVAAQQQRPQEQSPEDDTEAREFAQALDLYTAQGQPDVEKARKILGVVDRRAESKSQQAVAPLAQHTVSQQAQVMLARAKNTASPTGVKPDPDILAGVWKRLDPALTATPDGAKQAWNAALGYSVAMGKEIRPQAQTQQRQRTATGQFASGEEIPPPLHTEKAGGKDIESAAPLSDAERKYLKDAGISEKEYFESAKSAPWLRR